MKAVNFSILYVFFFVAAHTQPAIKFDRTSHNFGDVVETTYPKTTFTFYNTGNENLRLTDVKAGCGCTSPAWPRGDIAPGDSGKIDVVFNTNGYANRDFAKSVSVVSNAVNEPHVILYISGHVVPKNAAPPQYPFELSANYLDFSVIQQGKTASKTIVLKNKGDSIVKITRFGINCPVCLNIQANKLTIYPKDSAIITFTYNGSAHDPRNFIETVRIFTSIPDKNANILVEKGISVFGEVVSREKFKEIQKARKQAEKEQKTGKK